MKQTFTQSMAWLHTWAGLIIGWLLFAIFLTGTLAVFDQEISYWMQPELPQSEIDAVAATAVGQRYLETHHGDARNWSIGLPSARNPVLSVGTGEGRRARGGQALDPETGAVVKPRETAGGQFFFRFHYTLHMPRNIGIWVVGFAAMGMLTALISGIVTHKKIFKEFFTFRPAKGQRSWLDSHNATGVLVLPFHLMITYTGLVIFYLVYMPAGVDALYDGDRQAFAAELRGETPQQETRSPPEQREAEMPATARNDRVSSEARGDRETVGREVRAGAGEPQGGRRARQTPATVPMVPLSDLVAQAERHFGEGNISAVRVSNPGRADAKVSVSPILGYRLALSKGHAMEFDGVTGKLLRAPSEPRASQLTQQVMAGLHFAQFGGYPMRWLYFLCGLASCAMIATGLILFTVKRRRKYASSGRVGVVLYRVLEALNVSVVAGLAIACAAFLWGNRLLPAELSERGDREVGVFFLIWAVTLLHALWRPALSAWREQLAVAAVLCCALPLLDVVTAPLVLQRVVLDGTVFALGLVLVLCALRVTDASALPMPKSARTASGKNHSSGVL